MKHHWTPVLLWAYFSRERIKPWRCEHCGKVLNRRYVSHRRGWQVPKSWHGECSGVPLTHQPLAL